MGAPIMRIEPRRQSNDCAVWALATYLDVPYDAVWQVVVRLDRSRGRNGLHTRTIRRVADALKRPLRRLPPSKVTEDSYGVLIISDRTDGHAIVIRNGLAFDTDSTVWDLPSWLSAREAVIEDLLTEEDQ
jgi:hypothetical protein